MKRFIAYGAVVLTCGYMLPGCALTSKADAALFRYFTVDASQFPAKAEATDPDRADTKLRIGRITSSGHLRNRIVYRTSPVEVGVYEDRRWTERPEEYVRRAIAHALFDERGLTQVVAGNAPTLDVELLAFEEIRNGDDRIARVSMHFALHDERTVLVADTVTIEVPAKGDGDTEQVVAAISAALSTATAHMADDVTARLAPTPGAVARHTTRD
jgi:cholesterol transport system auxiliary component